MVFSDRIDGTNHAETQRITTLWNNAIDGSTLSRCRFREGDWVRVVRGEHVGAVGVIETLGRRFAKPYLIRTVDAAPDWKGLKNVDDMEVEEASRPPVEQT
jgi:hypothetical protein